MMHRLLRPQLPSDVDIFRHHLFGLVKGKGLCQTFVIYFLGKDYGENKKTRIPRHPSSNLRQKWQDVMRTAATVRAWKVLRMAEETVGGLSDWQRSFCTPEVPKGWSGWSQGMDQNSGTQLNRLNRLSRRWKKLCVHPRSPILGQEQSFTST